jgi:hypothetical protein
MESTTIKKADIQSMTEARRACCLIRAMLWFCKPRICEVKGWYYWVEYKEIFGKKYFIRAYVY